jgi:hypothetical protein
MTQGNATTVDVQAIPVDGSEGLRAAESILAESRVLHRFETTKHDRGKCLMDIDEVHIFQV